MWRCSSLQDAATFQPTAAAVRIPNPEHAVTITSTFTVPRDWGTIQALNLSISTPAIIFCDTAGTPCLSWEGSISGPSLKLRHIEFRGAATPFIHLGNQAFLELHKVHFTVEDSSAVGFQPSWSGQVVSTDTIFANLTLRPDATDNTCRHARVCITVPPSPSPTPSASSSPSITLSTTATPSISASPSWSRTPSLSLSPSPQTPSSLHTVSPSLLTSPSCSSSAGTSPHSLPFQTIAPSIRSTTYGTYFGGFVSSPTITLPSTFSSSFSCNQWTCQAHCLGHALGLVSHRLFLTASKATFCSARLAPSFLLACTTSSVEQLSVNCSASPIIHAHFLFLVPPIAWLQHVKLKSTIGANKSLEYSPYEGSNKLFGAPSFSAFLYGNDRFKSRIRMLGGDQQIEIACLEGVLLLNVSIWNVSLQGLPEAGLKDPTAYALPQPLALSVGPGVDGTMLTTFPPWRKCVPRPFLGCSFASYN